MMDPVSAALVGGLAVTFVVWRILADPDRRVKRKLRRAPRREIQHLPDGAYARYTGKVLPITSPLIAPLSGRRCTFWRVVVDEQRGRTSSEIIRRGEGRDFMIRDDTGTLLVRVADAELAMDVDGKFSSGVFTDPTPVLERFLATQGEKSTGILFNRRLRFEEAVIEAGESVTVAGVAHAEPDPDAQSNVTDYRATPMRMVLTGTKGVPVLISDDQALAKKH